MSATLTLLILLLWLAQGIGFVKWLMPGLTKRTLVGWVVATWLGLLLSLLLLVNLYFVIPGATAGELALPVTVTLCAISIALYAWKPLRLPIRIDSHGMVVLALTTLATLAVLRPLIGQASLGFYFSNNGEFSNYAAIADAVQFHDATTNIGGFPSLRSREAVAGLLGAVVAALTGKAALWVIQPVAAALAATAFASLGMLFRHCAIRSQARRPACALLSILYGWAILSAASQEFWTLSFMSQYLSVALWFGALVFLAESHGDDMLDPRIRTLVFGLVLGALICSYPEMIAPAAMLLAAFELACAPQNAQGAARAALSVVAAAGLGALLANRIGFELVIERGAVHAGGWNIFGPGPHHPILGFVGNVTGLSNTFSGPQTPRRVSFILVTSVFAAGLSYALVRAPCEQDVTKRGLLHLNWIFFLGVAALFIIVSYRRLGTNYIALKFILGFGWLAYLGVGFALLALPRSKVLPLLATLLVLLAVDLGLTAHRFSRFLLQDSKQALFLETDAAAFRAKLPHATKFYIPPTYLAIVGHFIAYDRDLVSVVRHWPDGQGQELRGTEPVLLVGKHAKLDDDPKITGQYQRRWASRNLVVMEPTLAPN